MTDYEPRFDLPAAFNREIGRIIVRYAHLEHYARIIIYHLLDIEIKQGRIAVREPELAERIEMIAELCHLQNLQIDETKLDKLKQHCQGAKTTRDLLAHGLWALNAEKGLWIVQMARGTRPKVPFKPFKSRHEAKQKLRPVGVTFNVPKLDYVAKTLEMMINQLSDLDAAVLLQRTSNNKSPPPPPYDSSNPARKSTRRQALPLSSPRR